MTLALYGKSRKRQGSLLLAALLAIIAASVGGLAIIGSAFAHDTTVSGTATCNTNGSFTITWNLRNDWDSAAALSDVNLSAGSWVGGAPTSIPQSTNGVELVKQSTAPAGTTSVTLSFTSTWPDNYVDDSNSATVDLTDFCAKVIIRKVQVGGAPHFTFSADVIDKGPDPDATIADNVTFADNLDRTVYISVSSNGGPGDNDDFKVLENPVGNFATSYKVLTSDTACGSDGYTSGATVSGGNLDNIDGGNVRVVCFKNTAKDDITISQGECAVTTPGWVFHFVAPNTDAGSGGNITVGYKVDGGATQYTSPTAENGNGAKANWHITIPFNGGNTVTIVSATTSTGLSWDGVKGLANATGEQYGLRARLQRQR